MGNTTPETNNNSLTTAAEHTVITPDPTTGVEFKSGTEATEKLHEAATEVGGKAVGHETPVDLSAENLTREQPENKSGTESVPSLNPDYTKYAWNDTRRWLSMMTFGRKKHALNTRPGAVHQTSPIEKVDQPKEVNRAA